ncbi:metallothionein-4-like [Episyrphus balteatus]|nr:metallothionein-4-like [Episyrphus balteatus]
MPCKDCCKDCKCTSAKCCQSCNCSDNCKCSCKTGEEEKCCK